MFDSTQQASLRMAFLLCESSFSEAGMMLLARSDSVCETLPVEILPKILIAGITKLTSVSAVKATTFGTIPLPITISIWSLRLEWYDIAQQQSPSMSLSVTLCYFMILHSAGIAGAIT